MRTPVVRTTVERLISREAFAARKVHAALRTTHHVFCTPRRLLRAALDLALVTLEYPVGESEPEDEKEDLCQAAVRVFMLTLVCRKVRRTSSGFHALCNRYHVARRA